MKYWNVTIKSNSIHCPYHDIEEGVVYCVHPSRINGPNPDGFCDKSKCPARDGEDE